MEFAFSLDQRLPGTREQVFDALTDLDRAGEWIPDLVRMTALSPAPFGPGSRWRETRRMFGGTADAVFVLADWTPPSTLTLTVDGKVRYRFDYALAAEGESCALTVTTTIALPGRLSALFAPLLAWAFKAAIRRDLKALEAWLAKTRA